MSIERKLFNKRFYSKNSKDIVIISDSKKPSKSITRIELALIFEQCLKSKWLDNDNIVIKNLIEALKDKTIDE